MDALRLREARNVAWSTLDNGKLTSDRQPREWKCRTAQVAAGPAVSTSLAQKRQESCPGAQPSTTQFYSSLLVLEACRPFVHHSKSALERHAHAAESALLE
jgi:hypothetical protein